MFFSPHLLKTELIIKMKPMSTTTLTKNTAANPICYSSLHMLTDLKQPFCWQKAMKKLKAEFGKIQGVMFYGL